MKKFFILIAVIVLFSCLTDNSLSEKKGISDTDYFLKPLQGKNTVYLNVIINKDLKKGSIVRKGDILGYEAPFPEKYSERNDSIIKESIDLYNKQKYASACDLLKTIENEESDNLFFLYFYARALFWIDNFTMRKLSFDIFKKMEEIIDKNNKGDPNIVIIDFWFSEIYWKLAGLYLDYHEYDNAIYEIAKFIEGSPGLKKQRELYEQVLSYLTEAYYFNNDLEMNSYFYKKTLREFPGNGYVLNFKL